MDINERRERERKNFKPYPFVNGKRTITFWAASWNANGNIARFSQHSVCLFQFPQWSERRRRTNERFIDFNYDFLVFTSEAKKVYAKNRKQGLPRNKRILANKKQPKAQLLKAKTILVEFFRVVDLSFCQPNQHATHEVVDVFLKILEHINQHNAKEIHYRKELSTMAYIKMKMLSLKNFSLSHTHTRATVNLWITRQTISLSRSKFP